MINYGPPPPLPGASQRGEWGRWRGRKRALRRQTSWWDFRVNDVTFFFFSFLALFCLKQEKPDLFFFFLNHHSAFFFIFFFEKESSKMWIDIVIFFFFLVSTLESEKRRPACVRIRRAAAFSSFFFFFLSFYVFVADVTPRRRSGKHLFRWNQTQETRNVSAVAFLPNTTNPSPIPPSQQGATFLLQQELGHFLLASERADLFVQDPPPCNVNLGLSGFWQKLHKNMSRKTTLKNKTKNLRLILILLRFFLLFFIDILSCFFSFWSSRRFHSSPVFFSFFFFDFFFPSVLCTRLKDTWVSTCGKGPTLTGDEI